MGDFHRFGVFAALNDNLRGDGRKSKITKGGGLGSFTAD
jgi:hypothetical protein